MTPKPGRPWFDDPIKNKTIPNTPKLAPMEKKFGPKEV